eukprot:COSAG04_NODE_1179_length_7905_cov_12.347041_8_plen_67_part_00
MKTPKRSVKNREKRTSTSPANLDSGAPPRRCSSTWSIWSDGACKTSNAATHTEIRDCATQKNNEGS